MGKIFKIFKQIGKIFKIFRKMGKIFKFFRKIGKKKQKFRLWRQKFISGLQSIGLDIESVSITN